MRCCPLAAAGLALLGLGLAWRRLHGAAIACLCAAAGPLAFSLFRLLLASVWRDDPVWFVVWEEFGELACILALGWVLIVFRRRIA